MVLVDLWGDKFWKGVEKTVKDGQSSRDQEVQKNLPLRQKPFRKDNKKTPEKSGVLKVGIHCVKNSCFWR